MVLTPASLDIAFTSTLPEPISGTSLSNSFFTKEGSPRERIICFPRGVSIMSLRRNVSLWFAFSLSLGTLSSAGIIPSVLPTSILTSAPSNLKTIPEISPPTRVENSSIITPFSASLIF